jgi:peptidylprolyl isomerase
MLLLFVVLYMLIFQQLPVFGLAPPSSWSPDVNPVVNPPSGGGLLRRQVGSAVVATWMTSFLPSLPANGNTEETPLSLSNVPQDFQVGTRGIKYKILQQGQGDSPVRGQQVYTKYTLWTGGFGDDGGKQVDSNTGFLGRPLPVIVGIGRVIKGWDLTLLDMKVGEVRRIIIPSDLGYGDAGAGVSIPPKATLYFEVQMTEMDPVPFLTENQQKWLQENPL